MLDFGYFSLAPTITFCMHSWSFFQLLLHLLNAFSIIQEQENAYSVFAHSFTFFFAWFGFFLFRFCTSIICSLIFQLLSGLPFCGHLVLLQVFSLLRFKFSSCSEFPFCGDFAVVVHFGLTILVFSLHLFTVAGVLFSCMHFWCCLFLVICGVACWLIWFFKLNFFHVFFSWFLCWCCSVFHNLMFKVTYNGHGCNIFWYYACLFVNLAFILCSFAVVEHFGLTFCGFGFFFTFVNDHTCFCFMHACSVLFPYSENLLHWQLIKFKIRSMLLFFLFVRLLVWFWC